MLRYAITPEKLRFQSDEDECIALAQRCVELARMQVDFLLIREKTLAAGDLAKLCRRVIEGVRGAGSDTQILVAGRPDIAVAVGANGVHLSAAIGELTPLQVHKVFRLARLPQPFVSVSCHSLEEVRRARGEGASAVLFAPVFGKRVDGFEVVTAVGLERLHEACAAAGEMPVFALGGVTEENAAACTAAGAAGVAGIRMFFGE